MIGVGVGRDERINWGVKCRRVKKAESRPTRNSNEVRECPQCVEQVRHQGRKPFNDLESNTCEILEIIKPQQCGAEPEDRDMRAAGRPVGSLIVILQFCQNLNYVSPCWLAASAAQSEPMGGTFLHFFSVFFSDDKLFANFHLAELFFFYISCHLRRKIKLSVQKSKPDSVDRCKSVLIQPSHKRLFNLSQFVMVGKHQTPQSYSAISSIVCRVFFVLFLCFFWEGGVGGVT